MAVENENTAPVNSNFIRTLIEEDIEKGATVPRKWCGHPAPYSEQVKGVDDPARIRTRFPPEPNGYLHIGHAKSICINFGMTRDFGGYAHMRFDDTNPGKESPEYVESIKETVKWLGFSWEHNGENDLFFASSYFKWMYQFAEYLIRTGYAYVDEQTQDEMRANRGTLTEPGKDSPFRNRSVEENLRVFREMRDGKHPEGSMVLRAKIDMASPNVNLRDPAIYRIRFAEHQETGNEWCIYPMYTFAHPIEDAIEGVTHSICTLEFEDHRPLYDWVVKECEFEVPPRQIEFAKMYLTNVVTGKRYIKKLVEDGIVDGWDDPRLVTITALRRRGYTASSIRKFMELCGVSKSNSSVDSAMLEYCIREDLKMSQPRMMAVLDPVKLVIDNYEEGKIEYLDVPNNQENPELGTRKVPFGRELYIEREDFKIDPPRKYFRLFPGNEVRLMSAYFVTCTGYETDEDGNVTVVHATYDPETKSGSGFTGRKVKGTIHWVAADTAAKAEVRLYENIVDEEKGVYNEDGSINVNPNSLTILKECYMEPALKEAKPGDKFQFMRTGFFCVDTKDTTAEHMVFNRIVSLKSSYRPNK